MIWVWVLVAVVATLFVWFWRWGSQATPIRFTQPSAMRQALRWVVVRGVYKGDLRGHLEIFVRNADTPTLVFMKEKYGEDDFGVIATIHLKALEVDAKTRLRAELTGKGIKFRELSDADNLTVDIRRDFGLALVLFQTVCLDVAGASVETDCVGYLRDVVVRNAPSLTGVDASDEEVWFK